MNLVVPEIANPQSGWSPTQLVADTNPAALAGVYDDGVNLAVWRRSLPSELQRAVAIFMDANPTFQTSLTVSANEVLPHLLEELTGSDSANVLCEDIAVLVDMFCCLFDLDRVGLRMNVLGRAMCPRFHVDRVPCRLVTTYQGPATEWLPNRAANRSKLGHGAGGLPDHASGLFQHNDDVQRLKTGDVALLKGELWEGNESAGVIHRSPCIEHPRLLLTLDFNF